MFGGIVSGLPPWLHGREDKTQLLFFGLAYLSSAALLAVFTLQCQKVHYVVVVLVSAIAFALPVFCVWFVGIEIPLSRVLIMTGMAIVLNICLCQSTTSKNPVRMLMSGAAVAALLAMTSLSAIRSPWVYRGLDHPFSRVLETSKHKVQFNLFREHIPRPEVRGGGLVAVAEKFLLATGDGIFYLLDISSDGNRLNVWPMGFQVPMNTSGFLEQSSPDIRHNLYRTVDVLLLSRPRSSSKQILVSHHYWHQEKACYTLRVSIVESSEAQLLADTTPDNWRTLYETTPCLSIMYGEKAKFAGHMVGGRMVQLGPNRILLSVGDLDFDGNKTVEMLSQDMSSDYGKIIEISTDDGSSRIFSSGLRNPQGLHIDQQGRIWATDHGPAGGDELNLVEFGNNYGWPLKTLGTDYEKLTWPPAEGNGSKQTFTWPLFAWNPSIAPSSLTSVVGGSLHRWQGDLIVSSLSARSLYRVPLGPNGPVMAEPIQVYERVRDIVLDSKGRIIFWADDAAAIGLLQAAAD